MLYIHCMHYTPLKRKNNIQKIKILMFASLIKFQLFLFSQYKFKEVICSVRSSFSKFMNRSCAWLGCWFGSASVRMCHLSFRVYLCLCIGMWCEFMLRRAKTFDHSARVLHCYVRNLYERP